MQQYLLQDGGIGSDITSIDERLSRLISFLEAGKNDDAKTELTNLRYTFFSTISGLDFKCRAFACFIKEVDGKEYTDFSSEGITRLTSMFDEMPVQEMEQNWEHVKKKLIPNSTPIFQVGLEPTLSTLKD